MIDLAYVGCGVKLRYQGRGRYPKRCERCNREHKRAYNLARNDRKREWEEAECPTCGGSMADKRATQCTECEREQRRREARERIERFIALRKQGLLNTEIAKREGCPRYIINQQLHYARKYNLEVPPSPYRKKGMAA